MYKILWLGTNTTQSSAALYTFLPSHSRAPRPIGPNLTGRQQHSTSPLRSLRRRGVPCPERCGEVSSRVDFRGLGGFRELEPAVAFGVRVDVCLEARLLGAEHPSVAGERCEGSAQMGIRHVVPTHTQTRICGEPESHIWSRVEGRECETLGS